MKNLYVGNLPHSTTEPELRGLFEAHGAVERVSIVTDRETGRARGFAFVEMTNPGEAAATVATITRATHASPGNRAGSQLAFVELAGRGLTLSTRAPKLNQLQSASRLCETLTIGDL